MDKNVPEVIPPKTIALLFKKRKQPQLFLAVEYLLLSLLGERQFADF